MCFVLVFSVVFYSMYSLDVIIDGLMKEAVMCNKNLRLSIKVHSRSTDHYRTVNPPFLAGRLPVLEAVSLPPYFKRNLPVFENSQPSNIKVIVYANDMGKNSLFSFTNFLPILGSV